MASHEPPGQPWACPACSRADPARRFFCRDCISACLADHHARKHQLRNALTLVTAKANALLAGTDRPHSAGTRGPALGVTQERLLKADKWNLASRAYAAREAAAQTKQANSQAERDLQDRRAALSSRRANLSTARSLLASLASSSPSTSALSLPDSLPALSARIETLTTTLTALEAETARVADILKRELVAVFALTPLERPLADPFLSHPAPASSLALAVPASQSARPRAVPAPPAYHLAHLPLPPLSALLTLPLGTLEAVLAQLAHLVRLLALYDRVALPYTPLPGLFGPGRAGVRAAPGWARAEEGGGRGEDERATDGARKRTSALGTSVWPLVFGSRRRVDSAATSATAATTTAAVAAAAKGRGGNRDDRQPGRGGKDYREDEDDDNDEDDAHGRSDGTQARFALASAAAVSSASFSSAATIVPASTSFSSPSTSTKRSTAKRAKLVLGGAVALAIDLAYLAWKREGQPARTPPYKVIDELDDLGALIARAAGWIEASPAPRGGLRTRQGETEEPPGGAADGIAPEDRDHDEPFDSTTTTTFPQAFVAEAWAHYAALVRSSSSSSTSSRTGQTRGGAELLEESGVVVEGESVDPEEDEDEGWDLI